MVVLYLSYTLDVVMEGGEHSIHLLHHLDQEGVFSESAFFFFFLPITLHLLKVNCFRIDLNVTFQKKKQNTKKYSIKHLLIKYKLSFCDTLMFCIHLIAKEI